MKYKIYFGLFILILCFVAGGLYIGKSIDDVTDKLETIITLNKVGFIRETLLNEIVLVQADLLLKDSPHPRQINEFVRHVEKMNQSAHVCLTCHHEPETLTIIENLNKSIDIYLKQISRVLTIRANLTRVKQEKEKAFDIGQTLIDEINGIVIGSSLKTSERINKARKNIHATKKFVYIFMVIGPLIIILAVYYFVRRLTGSILTLRDATRKVKEGDLNYRIKSKLKDEFQEVALSFNEMAASLTKQQNKIRRAERLAAVGELAAGLAHEVKNPLAGIKVSIEVLKNDLDLEQEDKEIFLRIINEINRIESLLKNMLDYARPLKSKFEPVSIHEILDHTIKLSEFPFKSTDNQSGFGKDIKFVRDYAPGTPQIDADPTQLQQVLLNIILNAIDAIVEKGTITIKTNILPNKSVQILISDTGKGIAPEILGDIFNPFFSTKSKGNGLGLAICKRLVEEHNGSISVSNNLNGGTTFSITLPMNKQTGEV